MLSRAAVLCKTWVRPFNFRGFPLGEVPKISSSRTAIRDAGQPAHQSVYEGLRNRILFGELAPGQAVTIQGLCEEVGAGMTPVREAIRRLIAAGALQMQGNRRVVVPRLTASGIEELDFIRQSLEGELARRATPKLTARDLAHLQDQDTALNAAIASGDIQSYLALNYNFHVTLYESADAPIMLATVKRVWLRFGPSLRVVCGRHGTMNLPDKHAELLDALAKGDAEAARHAVVEDVQQGLSLILAGLTAEVDPI